jgi:hypothetical protein
MSTNETTTTTPERLTPERLAYYREWLDDQSEFPMPPYVKELLAEIDALNALVNQLSDQLARAEGERDAARAMAEGRR